MRNIHHSAGNALIIVLILIALLAALTVTLTRMGSNANDVSQEQAGVIASQILRQSRTMADAVDGLIVRGCSINQLSFENSVSTLDYQNLQSPSNKSCWIFDGAGAGMAFPTSPASANDGTQWKFARAIVVAGVGPERETGLLCSNATCSDLTMLLPFVNLNVCKAINLSLGISASSAVAPPADKNILLSSFRFRNPGASSSDGNYSSINNTGYVPLIVSGSPVNTTTLWDKKSGCFEAANNYQDDAGSSQSGTGKYFFYQVLYER